MPSKTAIVGMLRTSRTLEILNVVGVGVALAAFVGGGLAIVFRQAGATVASVTIPTALAGTSWAALLRWRETVGRTRLRWGWLCSVPIAYLTSVVAIYFSLGREMNPETGLFDLPRVFASLLFGVFAAVAWGPSLVVTLICFGLPIAWAERLAKEGLAGTERGEAIVGGACLACSLLAIGIAPEALTRATDQVVAAPLLHGFAAAGVLTGAAAVTLAGLRELRRRTFVKETEAGRIPGYRVEVTPKGKRLLRVTSQGEGYRVADIEEELLVQPEASSASRRATV